jgi:hypothetical protein
MCQLRQGAAALWSAARGITVVSALVLAVPAAGAAQNTAENAVTEWVAAGDREVVARRPEAALRQFEAALQAAPSDYGVLWRTSAALIDANEFNPNAEERKAAFSRAGDLARRAIGVRPDRVEAHFHLARAIGREALSVGARERTKYALAVRDAALGTLAIDSLHAGALHIMGRWNAEVMRLNGFTRMIAKTFMGGKVFGEASWGEAVRLLERANALEPKRTVHLLALGEVYRDHDEPDKARDALQAAIDAPLRDANDEAYKREAARALKALR